MSLHPVSRILSFLILVIFLASMHLPGLFILGLVFFGFALTDFKHTLSVIGRFVWRLRWFWLSILLLYMLLPVEQAGMHAFNVNQLLAGLLDGLIRCLSLLLVIMYFVLLVHPIPLDQLQQAWAWLMRPLHIVGISSDLISLRIALTLHAVRELQTMQLETTRSLTLHKLPQQLFAFLQLAIQKSQSDTSQAACTTQTMPTPGVREWITVSGVAAALVIAQILG